MKYLYIREGHFDVRHLSLFIFSCVFSLSLFVMTQEVAVAKGYKKRESKLEGGRHWRCRTPQGSLHIWIPGGYQRSTAGVVLFVHGYSVNVDQAWRNFQLAKQFRKSKQNAMFIAVEAPKNQHDRIYWPELSKLRKGIRGCNIRLPNGSWIILGHSGAYRTIMGWVDYKLVREIILLDALYSGDEDFGRFIEKKGNKLILISTETSEHSRKFIKDYKYAVKKRRFPKEYSGFSKNEKRARLLYVKSQYQHHSLVANQIVIPLILRLTPLKFLQ